MSAEEREGKKGKFSKGELEVKDGVEASSRSQEKKRIEEEKVDG